MGKSATKTRKDATSGHRPTSTGPSSWKRQCRADAGRHSFYAHVGDRFHKAEYAGLKEQSRDRMGERERMMVPEREPEMERLLQRERELEQAREQGRSREREGEREQPTQERSRQRQRGYGRGRDRDEGREMER